MVYLPVKKGGIMLDMTSISQSVNKAADRYPIKKVVLFGSRANGSQTESSDVDLLVEFTSATVSLITLSALRQQLEDDLGTSVDLIHAPLPQDTLLDIGETVTLYER